MKKPHSRLTKSQNLIKIYKKSTTLTQSSRPIPPEKSQVRTEPNGPELFLVTQSLEPRNLQITLQKHINKSAKISFLMDFYRITKKRAFYSKEIRRILRCSQITLLLIRNLMKKNPRNTNTLRHLKKSGIKKPPSYHNCLRMQKQEIFLLLV